jgi:hypothetical protein
MTGQGLPVDQVVVYNGETFTPATSEKKILLCPAEPCNQAPDCSQAAAVPAVLWPPNHTLQRVKIEGVTDPDGDPVTITIDSVTQDEPTEKAVGVGDECPDAVFVDVDEDGNAESAGLRAERIGKGNGRVYVVHFTARDGEGGVSSGSATVLVPRDQAGGCQEPSCADDGQSFDATACPYSGGGGGIEAAGFGPKRQSGLGVVALFRMTPEPMFLRGDVNFDADLDVSDAIGILSTLFLGGHELSCMDAGDVNDDGELDISDPVALLCHLFLGGEGIAAPSGALGVDPTPDGLRCR